MKLTVFGTGYLGATHAACMAELGHEVLGVDIDEKKLESLQAGLVPFWEPGLEEVLKRNLAAGRLKFTSSYVEAAEFSDVHFLGVGTPQVRGEYAADLSYVEAVITTLAPLLTRSSVIIGKSTVPVGTAQRLSAMANSLVPADVEVEIAWNPEFLREGYAVQDTLRPDRLVLGVDPKGEKKARTIVEEIYAELLINGTPFIVTDFATAELVKASANAFLATKISFINAISEVCEAAGADVRTLADAIGHDDRIGRKFLNAGIGFGGGCLPKDIRAFMARAGELGAAGALTFLREVDAINMRRRSRTVELARTLAGGNLLVVRIGVLGAAFKPDSDDVRDSPALNIAGQLQLQGAVVTVHDPKAIENSRALFPTLSYTSDITAVFEKTDMTMLLTEWPEYRKLDPTECAQRVRNATVIDGRNCLDPYLWSAAGWNYHGMGVPAHLRGV